MTIRKRLAIWRGVQRLWTSGLTYVEACQRMAAHPVTVWRWRSAFQRGGPAALIPRRPPGRPACAVQRQLTPQIIAAVERLAVERGSVPAGWRAFSASPNCPRPLATVIKFHKSLPNVLLRSIRLRRVRADVVLGTQNFSVCFRL